MKLQELVVEFFRSLARHSIRRPWRALGMIFAVSLVAAPGIGRLKLRTDGHALVPQNAPEVIYDKTIRKQFGIEDNIVVQIRSHQAEGIFNPATLQLVRDLTAEFARLPGLGASNLMSLATETSFRFRPGALVLQTLLEPPLTTKAELDQLREDLQNIELYNGTLVSADGQSTAILIGVPAGMDCTLLYRGVQNVIAKKKSAPDEIAVTGAPVAESLLGLHILEDLGVPQMLLGTGTRERAEKTALASPANFFDLRLWLARRIGLVPVVIVVMMLILWASFRNWLATLVPLPGILATMLFVFGWMGWLGVPIYLTIVVMPVLLTATGVTNDIYLFNRYFSLLRENPGVGQLELLRETFDKLAAPVISTSLTTGVAFFSFCFSPLEPVRAFGLCAGVGILFSFLCSLTVVPALLTLVKPAWLASRRRELGAQPALITWFTRLGPIIVRWRWRAVVLVLLATTLTPLGLRRLVVQDSWTGGFDPRSDFSRATRQVNEQFFGIHLLFVSCDATRAFNGEFPASALASGRIYLPGNLVPDDAFLPGCAMTVSSVEPSENSSANLVWQTHIDKAVRNGTNLIVFTTRLPADLAACQSLAGAARLRFAITAQTQLEPQIIRAIGALGAFIRTRTDCGVGGVLDAADYLRTTRFLLHPDDVNAKILPASAEETKVLWDYYRFARGAQRLRQAVNADHTRSLATVFLKDANFVDTARLMRDLRAYEREHLTPLGIKIGFAGDVAESQSLIRSIVATQLQSLGWSLAGIFAVTAFFGGSLRWGFFCLLPSLLAVVIKFAVMGWVGIPLGVATSMFAAMTLGIGVNCAIHLLESCRQARAAGASPAEALNRALGLTGPPALINTLAMSLGFCVLMLSQVPANARLGLLLVLGLVNCFVASLLLLPVLLHWWPLNSKDKLR
jgi:predicted RND superfamily exporter protein